MFNLPQPKEPTVVAPAHSSLFTSTFIVIYPYERFGDLKSNTIITHVSALDKLQLKSSTHCFNPNWYSDLLHKTLMLANMCKNVLVLRYADTCQFNVYFHEFSHQFGFLSVKRTKKGSIQKMLLIFIIVSQSYWLTVLARPQNDEESFQCSDFTTNGFK